MRRAALVAALLALLLAVSCAREEVSIDQVQAVPWLEPETGRMGMALYIATSADEEETPLHLDLASPDGLFSWSLDASPAKVGGVSYAGSSDIAMPAGLDLPQGLWKLSATLPDGRVLDEEFAVSYSKPAPDGPLTPGPKEEGREYDARYDEDSGVCLLWKRP